MASSSAGQKPLAADGGDGCRRQAGTRSLQSAARAERAHLTPGVPPDRPHLRTSGTPSPWSRKSTSITVLSSLLRPAQASRCATVMPCARAAGGQRQGSRWRRRRAVPGRRMPCEPPASPYPLVVALQRRQQVRKVLVAAQDGQQRPEAHEVAGIHQRVQARTAAAPAHQRRHSQDFAGAECTGRQPLRHGAAAQVCTRWQRPLERPGLACSGRLGAPMHVLCALRVRYGCQARAAARQTPRAARNATHRGGARAAGACGRPIAVPQQQPDYPAQPARHHCRQRNTPSALHVSPAARHVAVMLLLSKG